MKLVNVLTAHFTIRKIKRELNVEQKNPNIRIKDLDK
jgi:hypothetical protein